MARGVKIHQYQWIVRGTCHGRARFESEVLARDEDQARAFALAEMADWSTGDERITSIEKTGYVLVHESELS